MTLFKIGNEPKLYDWGSKDLIPALMRTDSNGQPQAEVWLGTHHLDPAEVLDPLAGSLLERVACRRERQARTALDNELADVPECPLPSRASDCILRCLRHTAVFYALRQTQTI